MAAPKYSKIEALSDSSPFLETTSSNEASEPSLFHNSKEICGARNTIRSWKLATLALSVLLVISLSSNLLLPRYRISRDSLNGTYETGFKTDLKSVTNEIELVESTFDGGVELDDAGNYISKPSKYVGKPSKDVDRQWYALMTGLNLDLPLEEAEGIENNTYNWEDTDLYFTGLGVFHSLHCLNRIRQAFHPEYYHVFENPFQPPREIHINHCLDHLRQALQCHADLTPMNWARKDDKLILNDKSVHTCRNFHMVHEWAAKREVVYRKHAAGEKLRIID